MKKYNLIYQCLILLVLMFLISGCDSKEAKTAGVFVFILLFVIFVAVCYFIYFIIKVNQFVIQAINLYKEAIIKEEKIIHLLRDIRDGTKSNEAHEDIQELKRVKLVCCDCGKSILKQREQLEEIFQCPNCHTKNNLDLTFISDEMIGYKAAEPKDVTCENCNSIITLEGDDLEAETFVCPVCKTINNL